MLIPNVVNGSQSVPADMFGPPVVVATVSGPWSLAVIDLLADGLKDIVVGTSNADFDDGLFYVLNRGGGAFNPAVALWRARGPVAVASGDFDGDGLLDVLVGHVHITLFTNQGTGGGDAAVFPASGTDLAPDYFSLNDVLVHDLNKDGALDVVICNGWSDYVVMLFGNGDGTWTKVEYTSITGIGGSAGPVCVALALSRW